MSKRVILLLVLLILLGWWAYSRGLIPPGLLPPTVAQRVIPPATLHLRNLSTSRAFFYVDRQQVCDSTGLFSGKECTILVTVTRPRELAVITNEKAYSKVVSLQSGGEYQLLACGALGEPDQNCGLFVIRATPPTY